MVLKPGESQVLSPWGRQQPPQPDKLEKTLEWVSEGSHAALSGCSPAAERVGLPDGCRKL